MPPSVGMRFGRYEVLARLGSGGMGEVFRARDHDLQREVAIKFLPERFTSDTIRLSRFAQEARAASQLNHPNIVTIHEIGTTAGLPYIVMELVQGQTLRALLAVARPLPVRRTLEIASQLADGLAKAHAAGIVHRDLKPENVMVTEDGFVKILDFGLAKLVTSESGDREIWLDSDHPTWPEASPSPQTAAGAVLGTVGYMSPEQARGRPVDFRADQFAFGAIVYEMATGAQAFHRETPAQTLSAIIESPPAPIATRNSAFPAPARWLVERCLEKDPSARYASTLDLARDLRGLRERMSTAAGDSGSLSPDAAPAPSRLRRLALLAAVTLVLAALLSWTGPPVIDRVSVSLGLRPLPADKRVAVLPFAAPSGRPDDMARAAGLARLMTNRLAQLEAFQKTLSVEPESNVLESGVRSAEQARRALNATLVVTGSVQRVGESIVLIASIEDTRRNRVVRAARADDEDALIEEVVRLLALELADDGQAALRASAAGVAEAATLTAQGLAYTPYAEGRTALERYDQLKSLERAIELFGQALERDPRYALAHAGLAQAFWRQFRIEKKPELARLAEEHARRCLEIDDLPAGGWVTMGMIHAGTGRAEEALRDFQRALDRNPRSADAHRERAEALERLGRWDEAEAAYHRAIELRPESWANQNYLGAFLAARGRFEEAERAFRAALALAPDNARAWSNLGATLIRLGRMEEAETALEKSLDLSPSSSAFSNLGVILFRQGRWADAARTFERATAVNARDYRVWRNLGAARYWAPGERDQSQDAYRRAAELGEEERKLDPGNPRLLAELAECRAMLGQRAASRRVAEEAAAIANADVTAARTLADTYEQLGEREDALRWLGVALRGGYTREDFERDPWLERLRTDQRYEALVGDRLAPGAKTR
jgi:tetratricopeptide (TPR) repeat protein